MADVNVLTVATTFSIPALKPHMDRWLRVIGSQHTVELESCTLLHRYLLDPRTGLNRHPYSIHAVLIRFDDWNNFAGSSPDSEEIHPESRKLVEQELRLAIEALETIADTFLGTLILVVCPLTANHRRRRGICEYFENVEARLRQVMADYPRFVLVKIEPPSEEFDSPTDANDDFLQGEAFAEGLARRIVQTCQIQESRPWQGLVVSPGGNEIAGSREFREFVAFQWRSGRRVALAADPWVFAADDDYAASDRSPAPAWEKLEGLTRRLLLPQEDVIFLGAAIECDHIQRRTPQVLALPVFDRRDDWDAVLRLLWCLQPIPEYWLGEPDMPRPGMPRLSGRVLLELAVHPHWPADLFLNSEQAAGFRHGGGF